MFRVNLPCRTGSSATMKTLVKEQPPQPKAPRSPSMAQGLLLVMRYSIVMSVIGNSSRCLPARLRDGLPTGWMDSRSLYPHKVSGGSNRLWGNAARFEIRCYFGSRFGGSLTRCCLPLCETGKSPKLLSPEGLYEGSALRTYVPGRGQFRGRCSDIRRFIQRRDFRVNARGFPSYFPPTEE